MTFIEITDLKAETRAVNIPEKCPHCKAPVVGYEELGLVFERMHCDKDGDGFDSSTGDREYVTDVECNQCGESLVR